MGRSVQMQFVSLCVHFPAPLLPKLGKCAIVKPFLFCSCTVAVDDFFFFFFCIVLVVVVVAVVVSSGDGVACLCTNLEKKVCEGAVYL